MGYEHAFLTSHPALFTYSLETRLLPKQRILVVLREKDLISTDWTLYKAAVLTESNFFQKFVQPFKDDVPDLYQSYDVPDLYQSYLSSQGERLDFKVIHRLESLLQDLSVLHST